MFADLILSENCTWILIANKINREGQVSHWHISQCMSAVKHSKAKVTKSVSRGSPLLVEIEIGKYPQNVLLPQRWMWSMSLQLLWLQSSGVFLWRTHQRTWLHRMSIQRQRRWKAQWTSHSLHPGDLQAELFFSSFVVPLEAQKKFIICHLKKEKKTFFI